MRELVLVPIVGAVGGFSTALIALWVRYDRTPFGTDKRLVSFRYWLGSALINALGGGLASFFLWASFSGADVTTTAAPSAW